MFTLVRLGVYAQSEGVEATFSSRRRRKETVEDYFVKTCSHHLSPMATEGWMGEKDFCRLGLPLGCEIGARASRRD